MPFPIPGNEIERLLALQRYEILDTPPEDEFDDLVRLTAGICGTPAAFVGLIDANRQWLKAAVGLDVGEVPRDAAFCAHAILQPEVMVVPDLRADERFARNPLVREAPAIRFYAAAPLVTPDGFTLGTLCVIDYQPRSLTPVQRDALAALGRHVVTQLELRRQNRQLRESQERLQASMGAAQLAEEALRASEAFAHSVMDHMLEALVIVDESSTIISVNRAAERIFGYRREEMAGHHLGMLLPEEVRGDADAFLRSARDKSMGRLTEWKARRRTGEEFPFELSLFAFQSGGRLFYAGIIRDLSAREEVERLKKEFVATVSHELRTPLTSIRGALGLLAGGLVGPLPAEARETVQVAERNAVRLMALINDILDLERLERGRLDMRFGDTGLGDLLRRAVETTQAMAAEHGVSIEAPPTAARAWADADRLTQVLVNLLSNAIKFSPAGSVVTVAVREIPDWIEVRVVDSGRGIPPEFRDLVFQRFRQVSASDAREKGGTGLGLAICKNIVEQHGGLIGVDSEEGRGSAFWFLVPPAVARSPGAPPG